MAMATKKRKQQRPPWGPWSDVPDKIAKKLTPLLRQCFGKLKVGDELEFRVFYTVDNKAEARDPRRRPRLRV